MTIELFLLIYFVGIICGVTAIWVIILYYVYPDGTFIIKYNGESNERI